MAAHSWTTNATFADRARAQIDDASASCSVVVRNAPSEMHGVDPAHIAIRQGDSYRSRWPRRYSGRMEEVHDVRAAITIATVIFAAAACTSGSTPTAQANPVPSSVVSATPTGQTTPAPSSVVSATPTPVASPVPVAQSLCTLPVDRGSGALFPIPSDPNSLPLDDPASNVKLPDGQPRVGLSYDWAAKSWLPVPYTWVAADGAHYVYTDAQSRVHLVAVPGGADEILASGATWGIYSYGAGGIYAGQQDLTKQPSLRGLWRISPSGGTPEQLTSQGSWPVIGADAAWSVASSPQSQVSADGYGTVLSRFDLVSRQVSTWYSSTGGNFRVATVDKNGQALLVSRPVQGVNTISVVSSLGTAKTIGTATYIADVMADPHGVWYADTFTTGIYLVQSTVPQSMGRYGYGGSIKFAGPCR
jgi:hypothetical protein